MKKITFSHPHRQKHFNFFNKMSNPHFCITANVEISRLLPFLKQHKLPFNPTIVYLVATIANQITEFRWRIRGNEIIEHEHVHPSFSVFTEVADVFSFCYVDFQENYLAFIKEAQANAAEMEKHPSFEDEVGRDDFLFLSAIPWISFTGFQHAMHYDSTDAIPRIVWGKYFEQNGKIWMPLSVQAHHAIVDGRHVGKYFELMQEYLDKPKGWSKI